MYTLLLFSYFRFKYFQQTMTINSMWDLWLSWQQLVTNSKFPFKILGMSMLHLGLDNIWHQLGFLGKMPFCMQSWNLMKQYGNWDLQLIVLKGIWLNINWYNWCKYCWQFILSKYLIGLPFLLCPCTYIGCN